MSNCCVPATDGFFDQNRVRGDLETYRTKGPKGTTKKLVEALRGQDLAKASLLDVGAGIGIIGHELMPAGLEAVVNVDMAAASIQAAQEEAERRGHLDRIMFIHDDFVQAQASIPEGDVVTLDRVVCCYPFFEPLLQTATSKCRRLLALSYPRSNVANRIGFKLENWMQERKGDDFRVFVHPQKTIRALIEQLGFTSVSRGGTLLWNVEVYLRAA